MAYTLTKADVLLVAKELELLDEPRWNAAIATAKAVCSGEDAWGGSAKAKMAATYLAAHLAKLELMATAAVGTAAPSGPVSEISVGQVRKGFHPFSASMKDELDASLQLTPYGATFRTLQRTFSFGRFVVT
jgi:hypothetical protein